MNPMIIFLVLALFFSCTKKADETKRPLTGDEKIIATLQGKINLDKEIIQAPPALVPITSALDIEFRNKMGSNHLSGTILDKNPFSFKPSISGHATWLSPKTLSFIPENNLPAGKNVTGVLKGKILFGEKKDVNNFTFSFKVAEQEIIALDGDFEAERGVKKTVRYTGILTFAQPVTLAKVYKTLKMKGPKGKIGLSLEEQELKNRVKIISAPFIRTRKGQNFTLTLPGKFTANNKKWKKKLFLPGIDMFRVITHMDMSDPESDKQTYGFRFNDPLKKKIDLSGFVSITPSIDYKVKISGKYLKIIGSFLPGKQYHITIAKGLPSIFGIKLAQEYTARFFFNNIKPDLVWLSDGVFLPTSNEYKLQFKSVNVKMAQISVTEIFPQNIGFFLQKNTLAKKKTSSRYNYYGYSSSRGYQDLSRVGEKIYSKKINITDKQNKWIKTELDLTSVFKNKKNSLFVIKTQFTGNDLTGRCTTERDNLSAGDLYFEDNDYYSSPCKSGYYYSHGNKTKLLIASDIGLTVKKTESGIDVFATDVQTAQPLSGLTLSLFTYQNKKLETRTTDRDGYIHFSQSGSYVYGTNNNGIAIFNMNHPAWQINTFDVGGSTGGIKGTDVFMYTDRGVHRPGDSIHLAVIIRVNRTAPPKDMPVILEVVNPKGQKVINRKTVCGFNGHVYLPILTDISDPTGDWRAKVKIGDQTFTKKLKVETVKPNRLKITLDVPESIHAPDLTLQGTITTKYLFGAPAANLKANMKISLSAQSFRPAKYSDYIFTTPLKKYKPREHTVFDDKLNEQGIRLFKYAIPEATNVPEILRGILKATVYEKGGNFTAAAKRITIYPFSVFTGIKNIFRWRYAKLGETYSLPLVVVNPKGKPVEGHEIKVTHYVNRRHWWWHYDSRNKKDFRKDEATYKISEHTYQSERKPVVHKFPVEDYGQHLILVENLTSGHESGLFFYASSWGAGLAAEEKERNYLKIASDKNVYYTGDKATLSFDSPKQGVALISLEQGTRILHREWVPLKSPRTMYTFTVTDEMVPNFYATISLIQPHNQNTNDAPMRLYGIKTLSVENLATRLPLILSAPDELEPKKDFTVKITSKSSRKATYTIAIVDEGLLDLTGFETPDAWEHYFQKIRLAVQTSDNFDEIIGMLLPDVDKFFSIGGDEFEEGRKKRVDPNKTKRFKPVVLFQAPLTIKPGKTKKTTFTMPNYIGSVRMMIIGTGNHSYVSLEKTVPVKQPLMILPTIPRIARPGDQFFLPVSVFSMDKSVHDVTLSLKLSANLKAVDGNTQTMTFTKIGEQDTRFSVSVGNRIGADTIVVTAKAGKFSADYTVYLPVTSANPFYTEVIETTVVKDNPVTLIPKKFGLEGTNKAILAFSRIPDIQLDKRVKYLIRYPYGCLEQMVSSVFPQFHLTGLLELKSYQKQSITDNINTTIGTLPRFQMAKGFSSWPANNYCKPVYSNWGTSYLGHFIIEARELGYHVPDQLFNHWLRDAKSRAKEIDEKNHRFQTYRLFLLALAGKPHMGGMNLLRENHINQLDPLSRMFLATAYYLSGKHDIAVKVEKSIQYDFPDYREMCGTYGSSLRDRAFMSYLCLKMNKKKKASSLLRKVAKTFRPYDWYSTQETAITLLAIGAFYKASPFTGGSVPFTVAFENGKKKKYMLDNYQMTLSLDNKWNKKIFIKTKKSNPLFVTLLTEGIPIDNRIKTEHQNIEMTRSFYSDDGIPIQINNRKQGKPFWVVYSVTSSYGEQVDELALTSVFPSGWEIINFRVSGEQPPEWIKKKRLSDGEYMDIRDDRVNWFFDLYPGRALFFGIKLNPTFAGTYTLPPASVEAMYSPDFYARIKAGTTTVE